LTLTARYTLARLVFVQYKTGNKEEYKQNIISLIKLVVHDMILSVDIPRYPLYHLLCLMMESTIIG
jgi:hypothetical protein